VLAVVGAATATAPTAHWSNLVCSYHESTDFDTF